MRMFAFILSIYLGVLAVIPCNDGAEVNSHNLLSDNTIEHHDHSNSDHEEDGCSTFCSCACCGISLIIPLNQSVVQSESDLIATHEYYYSSDYSYYYILGIWHPPSLS